MLLADNRPNGILRFDTSRLEQIPNNILMHFYLGMHESLRKFTDEELNEREDIQVLFLEFVQLKLGHHDLYKKHLSLPLPLGSATDTVESTSIIQ